MAVWEGIVAMLYFGLGMLALLSVPLPQALGDRLDSHRRWIVDYILHIQVRLVSLRLIELVFLVSVSLVFVEYFSLQTVSDTYDERHANGFMNSSQDMMEKVKLFRQQRNWWISLFNLVVYFTLVRYSALLSTVLSLKEELKARKSE